MGWTNSHLHAFQVDQVSYIDPKMMDGGLASSREKSYAHLRISDFIQLHGPALRFNYVYDFGDGWEHEVSLKSIGQREAGVQYPRCLDGARACPPEDVGGIYGYEDMLQALQDPNHPEHDSYQEWAGNFEPEAFDLKRINIDMQAGLPSWH